MSPQMISAPGANLNANQFVKAGYIFTGWNTTIDGNDLDYADTTEYSVSEGEELKTTILYAQWMPENAMQIYTKERCITNATSSPETLTDVRDDQAYQARYINGVCTMINNLNFELTSGIILTQRTTNVARDITLGTVSPLNKGYSLDEPRMTVGGNLTYGAYYNYVAATAGTIVGEGNETEAAEDICPKGWRLPTGGQSASEQRLLADGEWQSGNTAHLVSFNAIAAGDYFDGTLQDSGSLGFWWSSSAISDDPALARYYLVYDVENGLIAGYGDYRGRGFSIRCVLK